MQPIYDFISKARVEKKPFFVWYAPMLPHSPHNAPQRLLDKYKDRAPSLEHAKYWASVEWFDETCGQLLDYLDQQALVENTVVVYVTDNGWVQGTKADGESLRSKRTPYDAGVRTPIMIRWTGKVNAVRSNRLTSSLDIMPTLPAAAGIKPPANLPGLQLLDTKAVNARNSVFGASFTHDAVELRNPSANVLSRWMIEGGWKLIAPVAVRSGEDVPDHPLLYNITADPEERIDLSEKERARVHALRRKLDAWWKPKVKEMKASLRKIKEQGRK